MPSNFYKKICCEPYSYYPQPYNFEFGSQTSLAQNQLKFQSNQIVTTKYNLINFIPKSVILQFKRLANVYFLLVAIIVSIPDVSPQLPVFIWGPFIFVLMVSVVKQGYQDYKRYKLDNQTNNQENVSVLRNREKIQCSWKNIKVGDLCFIKQDQSFPADLFLVSSSDPDGIAYISTASLDGEQTSKIRYSYPEISQKFPTDESLTQFQGNFSTDTPCPSLQSFYATIEINKGMKFTMNDNKQLLFRGAKLKNTKWIWGLVIYTGQCAKILQNSQSYKNKFSKVEKKLNYLLIFMLLIQFTACIVSTVFNLQSQNAFKLNHSYLVTERNMNRAQTVIKIFLMFFIEYSAFIPISLIVSIQLVKISQSYFIDFDQLMFSKHRKTKAYAKIAALNEELGQVQYVFTDKTGTLTQNKMKFHSAVIGNKEFQFTEAKKMYSSTKFNEFRILQDQTLSPLRKKIILHSNDSRQILEINNYKQLTHYYMMCLLICNNISVVQGQEGLIYEGQSPDEIALIYFASSMGYKLLKKDKNNIFVEIKEKPFKINIIDKYLFTSDRKRMSVIAEYEDKIMLFSKGADNIMLERILQNQFDVVDKIDQLSRKGLRTLMCSVRIISHHQCSNMKNQLDNASPQVKTILNQKYATLFETQLELLGATGLLDELQLGVPQVLKDLQRANIRVWMLTGDKLETAVEIGKSCNLINAQHRVIEMRNSDRPIMSELKSVKEEIINNTFKYSLVIEGSMVNKIMENQTTMKEFALTTILFETVICCRLLPSQKSQLVNLIKTYLNKICLSIGDGGNDVPMIKQAHIGIGLYGEEGVNAVQASDYALPQFRMLWRLLFVHGRWNYIRISQMILYFAYKSVFYNITRGVYAFYNGYSGYPFYDDSYMALFNLLFTSLPLIIRALFEQDINYVLQKTESSQQINQKDKPNILIKLEQAYLPSNCCINRNLKYIFPKLYYIGKHNVIFNIVNTSMWMLQGVVLGILTVLITIRMIDCTSLNSHGYNSSFMLISLCSFTSVVILVGIKIIVQIRHWTKLLLSCILVSLAFYLGFIWFINFFFRRPIERTLIMSFLTPRTYLALIWLSILCLAINVLAKFIRFNFNKTFKKILQEFQEDKQINLQNLSTQYKYKDARVEFKEYYSSEQSISSKIVREKQRKIKE